LDARKNRFGAIDKASKGGAGDRELRVFRDEKTPSNRLQAG